MKKTLRKPENWQDFETLCKKLWGEIWGIPTKIKKNGRLGQPQSGIDIYGIPKGESDHWGIQCKGKDDYTNSQLDVDEITSEIEKAKSFSPALKVYIIATTANKNSKIEQYIREIDAKNRNVGLFEVLLFCWEDIVDLIEENSNIMFWYLNDQNIRDKFDIDVYLNDFSKELTINPKYLRKTTKYKTLRNEQDKLYYQLRGSIISNPNFEIPSIFGSNKINRSWCKFTVIIANNGNAVLEDWKLKLRFGDGTKKIDDDFDINPMLSAIIQKDLHDRRTTFAYSEDKVIIYRPLNNESLIQKDTRHFTAFIIPENKADNILIEWQILARDYDKTGSLVLNVNPMYKDETNVVYVESDNELRPDFIEISELVEHKK